MNVVGLTGDGEAAFRLELGHGADPRRIALDLGYVAVHPIEALRNEDGVLDLSFLVRPAAADQALTRRTAPSLDPGLDVSAADLVEVRQRVAAYALVTSELGLLATEFSNRTAVPGRWGLPGGGIDDHEQPVDAVLREVVEETQQTIDLGGLVEVQTSHWIGRSPRNTIEDYHAVRLVYEATCAQPSQPVVVDVGGTTESACWVPLGSWGTLAWTAGWRQLLGQRVGRDQVGPPVGPS